MLTLAAIGVVVFGMVIANGWRFGPDGEALVDTLRPLFGGISKWSLDGTRFLAILGASWLVAAPAAAPLDWAAGSRVGRGLATIGRGGLWSFVMCVLLSIAADAAQMQAGSAQMRLAVDAIAIVSLWAAAASARRAV